MRLAIGIEYDGSNYNGWQRQRVGVGVQELLEKAASKIANENIEIVCAGRTDAGVHASGQVGHFDTAAQRSDRGWLLGINSTLPDDINVCWVKPVADDFHARFSAISRRYRYRILNQLARSALERERCWWYHASLDADAMQLAGQSLLGEHDFSAFRAAGCQANSAVRELQAIDVRRDGNWISIEVQANAFLQHMVRNIVGTLVSIGNGQHSAAWAREILDSRDRKRAGITAPPQGLSLTGVDYPAEFQIVS